MKIALAFSLAFGIGVICRLVGIPVPAPPAIVGALLVVAMTAGYLIAGHYATKRSNKHEHSGGGPTGTVASKEG